MVNKLKANYWPRSLDERKKILAEISVEKLKDMLLAVEELRNPLLMSQVMAAVQAAGYDRMKAEAEKNSRGNLYYAASFGVRFLGNPTEEFLLAALMSQPSLVNCAISSANGDKVFPEDMRQLGNKMLDVFDAIAKIRHEENELKKERELKMRNHPILRAFSEKREQAPWEKKQLNPVLSLVSIVLDRINGISR